MITRKTKKLIDMYGLVLSSMIELKIKEEGEKSPLIHRLEVWDKTKLPSVFFEILTMVSEHVALLPTKGD